MLISYIKHVVDKVCTPPWNFVGVCHHYFRLEIFHLTFKSQISQPAYLIAEFVIFSAFK